MENGIYLFIIYHISNNDFILKENKYKYLLSIKYNYGIVYVKETYKLTPQDSIEKINLFIEDLVSVNSPIQQEIMRRKKEVNFFKILKVQHKELSHSDFLAWILDPNENHGLGTSVIEKIYSKFEKKVTIRNYHSVKVSRELYNTDILVYSQKKYLLMCIENKVEAKPDTEQLERYSEKLKKHYGNLENKLLILLVPSIEDTSQREEIRQRNWCILFYSDLIEIIRNAWCENRKSNFPDEMCVNIEADLAIKSYINTVERYVMNEKKLKEICTDLYKKHTDVIDLFIANLPAYENKAFKALSSAMENIECSNICYENQNYDKGIKYIRFTTSSLKQILPISNDNPNKEFEWTNGNTFFYEICNSFRNIEIQLTLCGIFDDRHKKIKDISNSITLLPPGWQRNNYDARQNYKHVFTKKMISGYDYIEKIIKPSDDDIINLLKEELYEIFKEINIIEDQLISNWSKK